MQNGAMWIAGEGLNKSRSLLGIETSIERVLLRNPESLNKSRSLLGIETIPGKEQTQ